MAAGICLGGLLALGIEVLSLLLGAIAISKGFLREDCTLQLTAGACLAGGLAGGWLAGAWWRTRLLLAGMGAGAMCFLLILTAGLLSGGALDLGVQAAVEAAACLCGGAIAGVLGTGGAGKKKRPATRRRGARG